MTDPKRNSNLVVRIAIGMPTFCSSKYIQRSILRIVDEIKLFPNNYFLKLVVCLNGSDSENETIIRETLRSMSTIPSKLLILEHPGKNEAINAIARYSREIKCTILHLIDDDVFIDQGAILSNILALTSSNRKNIMVGSTFKANLHQFQHFLKEEDDLFKALKKCFWHNVFRIPFDNHSEEWLFCSAQSLALYIAHLPTLPPTSTGITDDAFLNNIFALNGKLIKPKNSLIYFNVADDFSDWRKQQTRILYGVSKSDGLFNREEINTIYNVLKWPYTGNKRMFTRPARMKFKRLFFYIVYMCLRKFIEESVAIKVRKNSTPNWGSVQSTKEPIEKRQRQL